MLKIYVQDLGWAGSIVVVASSEEDARVMMKDCYNYDSDVLVEEVEIKPGIVSYNLGDC